MYTLDLNQLAVESFALDPLPSGGDNAEVTNFSCTLSDDDFTCRDGCGSQAPGLTC